jgi:hypothetical protein
VHINVTDGPSARWTGQQIVNAFPYDSAPKYVIRDRDNIFGASFASTLSTITGPEPTSHSTRTRPNHAHAKPSVTAT